MLASSIDPQMTRAAFIGIIENVQQASCTSHCESVLPAFF